MFLGILADTHDELARTKVAVKMLREAGAEALVHCGDLASPPIVEAIAELPSWFVFGNHDADMVNYLQQAADSWDRLPACQELAPGSDSRQAGSLSHERQAGILSHERKSGSVPHGRCVCLGWGGVLELASKKIGVVHGHLTTDILRVLEARPDYLLTGHFHYPVDELYRGVRRINPGALHRADEFTVALLEIESGRLELLRVPE